MRSTTLTVAVLSALTLLACGSEAPPELKVHDTSRLGVTQCAGSAQLQGVDVSSYQGSINWGAVAGAGIKWGYAKATEGTGYQDPTFPGNWSGMKTAGLYRGAYHFFHPGIDGTAQADYFLNTVGAIGAGDLPPMLDWEVSDGVSGATASANAQAFINEVHARTGKTTVIYTSPGLWSGFGASSFGAEPLWEADYFTATGGGCYTSNTSPGGDCPNTPSGWSSWLMWQYGDCGSVSGIGGHVDVDIFDGDESALASFAGGGASCSNPIAIGHPVGSGGPISSGCTPGGAPGLLPAPTSCGGLASGQGLGPGQSVTSCDGRFTLVMQTDGNVVLYAHGIPLWATHTDGKGGYLFAMQGDGNLVLYDSGGCPIWASNTAGASGARLAVQDDGNVVLYDPSNAAKWSTGTGPVPPAPTSCGTIPSGSGLGPGDAISACGGCFTLVMQGDGNLVLYQNGGGALWSSNTAGAGGYTTVMQGDGNLVLYSSGGCPLWSSGTAGQSGATLAVQDDGNVVVYGPSGPAWASSTVACQGGCTCNTSTSTSTSTTSSGGATSTTSSGGATSTTSSGGATSTGGTSSTGSTTSSSGTGTSGTTSSGSETSGGTASTGSTGTGSTSGSALQGSTGSGSVSGSTTGSHPGSATGRGCGAAGGGFELAALLAVLGLARRRR